MSIAFVSPAQWARRPPSADPAPDLRAEMNGGFITPADSVGGPVMSSTPFRKNQMRPRLEALKVARSCLFLNANWEVATQLIETECLNILHRIVRDNDQ